MRDLITWIGTFLAVVFFGSLGLSFWLHSAVPIVVFVGVLLIPVVGWIVWSWCHYIHKDEVAVIDQFGDVGKDNDPLLVSTGRPIFVPIFPGVQLYRVPRTLRWSSFEGEEDDGIVDCNGVILLPQIDMSVRFPFKDRKAARLMAKSGVPTDYGNPTAMPDFAKWSRNEVITIAREILAGMTYKEARGQGKLNDINTMANTLLRRPEGLLVRSGVLGTDVDSTNEGEGEVTLRFNIIPVRKPLQDKIDGLAESDVDVSIAKRQQEVKAQNAGVPGRAYADWLKTKEGKNATPEEKRDMREAFRQKALAAEGKYQESALVMRGSKKDPLPGNLTYLSFGGGGPGIFFGGQNPGNPSSKGVGQPVNPSANMPQPTAADAQDYYNLSGGKIPSWAPPGWKPN